MVWFVRLTKNCGKHPKGSMHCATFHDTVRNDCILSRTHAERQVVHEAISTAFIATLETGQNETVCTNSSNSVVEKAFECVFIGSKHWHGNIFCEILFSKYSYHRCQWQEVLGRSHEQPDMSGSVDKFTEIDAHKLPGYVSSSVELRAFRLTSEEQKCFD
ncbi:hypothetical protein DPMN_113076 [Dreissena polymorpha]|uniref:Uncharacterized protein n=1 Tax=Dreissena polymorpha TaxID=45954 RepID=A0A9D4KHR8_DREPO|nr:hypothetical protein DPMN_113076 [Dreissena polymorpha]